MSKDKKLSENEFLAILRENGGLFARTAKAIEDKYKITYSRQSCRIRAEKHPKFLADIEEEMLDIAEAELYKIIKDEDLSSVRLKAIEFYLKCKGKKRDYVERTESYNKNEDVNVNVFIND